MFMIHEEIKLGLVTQHIPIKDVAKNITKNNVIKKVKAIQNSLTNDFNIPNPRIAVLGLNPHAGDNGLLGTEEQTDIIPAIETLLEQEILAYGPFSADSFFTTINLKRYNGILAMYHDQGLIPFKTLTFTEGVNFSAGLPKVRTSPDHGVGYDIAGEGIANESSFVEAMYWGARIFNNRKENTKLKSEALPEPKPEKRTSRVDK